MGQLLVCAGAQSHSPGRPATPLPGGWAALPAHWVRLEACGLHLPSTLCLGTAPRSRGLWPAAHTPVSLLPSCVCFLIFQEAPLKSSPPPLTPGRSPCGHRWPLTAVRSPLSPGPPGCAHQAIGAPENPANHRGGGGVQMKGETEGQRRPQAKKRAVR